MTDNVIRGVGAAVFDLDGTLFDSTRLWYDIDERFLSARGKTPTAEYKRAIAALGNRAAAAFTIKYYGLSDTVESLTAEWADMARHEYSHRIPLITGASEYLEEINAHGIKIYAATSLARELAEPCLKNNGIYRLFDGIITADETGLSKTSPDIYVHICRVADVEPRRAVAFDDVPDALLSAKRAGLYTVAVTGVHADENTEADFVIRDMSGAPRLTPQ